MHSNNTIFDDVFRTMLEKMPRLVIPLINEVFHTDYPLDVEFEQLRNEHQEENGEEITDSCIKIGKKLYHIECQSTDDTTMAVRMIEYDFYIAVEHSERNGRRYRIEFPKSCVLFLRSGTNTPDFLEAEIVFADETTHLYRIPTIKMRNYTKDALFQKNLLMLLPFYVMRYEKQAHELDKNPEKLHSLLKEYEELRIQLEKKLNGDTTGLYTDLIKLITKIADYIFRKEKIVRKDLGEIMGGKVLELESERLTAKGIQQGIRQGMRQGEKRLSMLINCLILDGRSSEIQMIINDEQEREKAYKEYDI